MNLNNQLKKADLVVSPNHQVLLQTLLDDGLLLLVVVLLLPFVAEELFAVPRGLGLKMTEVETASIFVRTRLTHRHLCFALLRYSRGLFEHFLLFEI